MFLYIGIIVIMGNIIVLNLFLANILYGFEHLDEMNNNNIHYLKLCKKLVL